MRREVAPRRAEPRERGGEGRGDTGGRELLDKYAGAVVKVPSDYAVLLDIDTPEEYEGQNSEFRFQNEKARAQPPFATGVRFQRAGMFNQQSEF